MTATVTGTDIAIRLFAALMAGALIGFDRSTRGRIAGLRTTILMCLAAAGAMIEANLMLAITGKTAESFTTIDVLRFPLGILSGIGFIGAGTIVRRGNLVTGVTTAASMWLTTVIGLILGAGYIAFGVAMTLIAFLVLTILKGVEPRLKREHRSHLVVQLDGTGPSNRAIRDRIRGAGYTISSFAVRHDGTRRIECHLEWYSAEAQDQAPELVEQLANNAGILAVEWTPISAGHLFE
ncbi:MAG: MgtC/SapB family protein [Alphaproteobacteria bacterium]|nr:MgtC/SapB family protein [Alphaproteobacteria bacterium]